MLNSSEINGLRSTWDNWLDHTCQILRRTQTSTDPYNLPVYGWGSLATGVPCHFWEEVDNEMVGQVNAVVTKSRIAMPADVDVEMTDRIDMIVSWLGVPVEGTFNIVEILPYVSGKVLALKLVE